MRIRLSILGCCATETNRSNSGPRAPDWQIPAGSSSLSSGWIGRRPDNPKLKARDGQWMRKENENEKQCARAKRVVYRYVIGGCDAGSVRGAADRRFCRGQRPGRSEERSVGKEG